MPPQLTRTSFCSERADRLSAEVGQSDTTESLGPRLGTPLVSEATVSGPSSPITTQTAAVSPYV